MSTRDEVLALHRAARAELREGMAAINRVNGVTMSEPTEPMKIIIEKSPWPNAEPQYRQVDQAQGLRRGGKLVSRDQVPGGHTVKIEKDIPIPTPGGNTAWPFATMEVGDSLLVPMAMRDKARQAVHAHRRRHPGFEFVTRTTENGLRLWRTA